VPEVSRFYGIIIYIYWFDHPPPHFHYAYGEYQGIVRIEDGQIEGDAPARVRRLVLEWLAKSREKLLEQWALAQKGETLQKIEPLV